MIAKAVLWRGPQVLITNELDIIYHNLSFVFFDSTLSKIFAWKLNIHRKWLQLTPLLPTLAILKAFQGWVWTRIFRLPFASNMATSLRSSQWSCDELAKGAAVCADLAGMELTVNPSSLSKEELLQSIKDWTLYLVWIHTVRDLINNWLPMSLCTFPLKEAKALMNNPQESWQPQYLSCKLLLAPLMMIFLIVLMVMLFNSLLKLRHWFLDSWWQSKRSRMSPILSQLSLGKNGSSTHWTQYNSTTMQTFHHQSTTLDSPPLCESRRQKKSPQWWPNQWPQQSLRMEFLGCERQHIWKCIE